MMGSFFFCAQKAIFFVKNANNFYFAIDKTEKV